MTLRSADFGSGAIFPQALCFLFFTRRYATCEVFPRPDSSMVELQKSEAEQTLEGYSIILIAAATQVEL